SVDRDIPTELEVFDLVWCKTFGVLGFGLLTNVLPPTSVESSVKIEASATEYPMEAVLRRQELNTRGEQGDTVFNDLVSQAKPRGFESFVDLLQVPAHPSSLGRVAVIEKVPLDIAQHD